MLTRRESTFYVLACVLLVVLTLVVFGEIAHIVNAAMVDPAGGTGCP